MFGIKQRLAQRKERQAIEKEELKKANNGHEFFYLERLHPMGYCQHCKLGNNIFDREARKAIIAVPCTG